MQTRVPPTSLARRRLLAGMAGAAGAGLAAPALAQASEGATGDILIGQSAHLSGPLAPTFTAVLRGQDMAIKEFNAKGLLGGRNVRLTTLDDAYDPAKTAANVRKLLERDDMVALYGLSNTAGVAASLPILSEKRVPLVGVYSGSPVLRNPQHPYFFTTMASYQDEVVQMVRNLVTLHCSRIGLAYQNSPFGQLMTPVVEQACKAQGAELVATAPLEVNGSDAQACVDKLAAAKPQALMFMSFGPSMVPFVKLARQKSPVPIYCVSIANSQQIIQALGPSARGLAIAQIVPYPFQQTSALTRSYHAAMRAQERPVDYDHFFGYMNMQILLEGLRRAGRNVNAQKLVAAVEGMSMADIGGYTVDFAPGRHHGSQFVELVMVSGEGRYVR